MAWVARRDWCAAWRERSTGVLVCQGEGVRGNCSVFRGRILRTPELSFRTQRQRSEESKACNGGSLFLDGPACMQRS